MPTIKATREEAERIALGSIPDAARCGVWAHRAMAYLDRVARFESAIVERATAAGYRGRDSGKWIDVIRNPGLRHKATDAFHTGQQERYELEEW